MPKRRANKQASKQLDPEDGELLHRTRRQSQNNPPNMSAHMQEHELQQLPLDPVSAAAVHTLRSRVQLPLEDPYAPGSGLASQPFPLTKLTAPEHTTPGRSRSGRQRGAAQAEEETEQPHGGGPPRAHDSRQTHSRSSQPRRGRAVQRPRQRGQPGLAQRVRRKQTGTRQRQQPGNPEHSQRSRRHTHSTRVPNPREGCSWRSFRLAL